MTVMFFRVIVLASSLVFLGYESGAQPKKVLPQLDEDKQNVVETIAMYPDSQRALILQASVFPEILVRMDHIRDNTEARFREMISGLSETDQKRIYNLARYPDLMKIMCDRPEKRSGAEMSILLDMWPEDIRVDAAHINTNHYKLLHDIQDLYVSADQGFADLLQEYPLPIRDVYHQLSQLPEVVSLLTTNLDIVVLLGEAFQHYPEQVKAELDALGVVVAEQQAKELNEWKKQLEENPEAMQEYESSAKEFAGEYGYDDDVYDAPVPEPVTHVVQVHHVWRPYTYWFGWPGWYEMNMKSGIPGRGGIIGDITMIRTG
jgi:hypothetical protein